MKKLNKMLSICFALLLIATAAVAGTLAYNTTVHDAYDPDEKLLVDMIEVGDFEGNTVSDTYLVPMHGDLILETSEYNSCFIRHEVFAKNTGNVNAWVRVVVAIPAALENVDEYGDRALHLVENSLEDWSKGVVATNVIANGVPSNIYIYTYQNVLKSGDKTPTSPVLGVYLDPAVDNDTNGNYVLNDVLLDIDLNDGLEIPVAVQAIQETAFASASSAFETVNFTYNPWSDVDASMENTSFTTALRYLPDGTDISKKVTKIVFDFNKNYPEIAGNDSIISRYADDAAGTAPMVYYVPNYSDDGIALDTYTLYILSDDVIYLPENSQFLFRYLANITTIDTTNLDVSKVENAYGMFYDLQKLTDVDVSKWDTSSMTNMGWMFYNCRALKTLDVSGWSTDRVTTLRGIFSQCRSVGALDVSGRNTENVTDMCKVFHYCFDIKYLDCSNWVTNKVTTMNHMFANTYDLSHCDISGFDTSKVSDMAWMFYSSGSSGTGEARIYVGEKWNTSLIAPGTGMFWQNTKTVGGNGEISCTLDQVYQDTKSQTAGVEYARVPTADDPLGLFTFKQGS